MEKTLAFTQVEQVLHRLFLGSYALKDPGLLFGRLGIAIACLDYGKRSGNRIVSDFGDELTDGILDSVDHRTGFDFATGLAGIAWGIEYIIQQGYVDCDSNMVCGDLDERLMRVSVCRLNDYSLDGGLEGLLHYVLMRIRGALLQNNPVPFPASFLDDVLASLRAEKLVRMPASLAVLAKQFEEFRKDGTCVSYQPDIRSFIEGKAFSEEIDTAKLGLKNGLAGWLLTS